MSNQSITDHMVPHNLYGTLDSISEDLSIPRIVIYLLQFLDSLNTSIQDI